MIDRDRLIAESAALGVAVSPLQAALMDDYVTALIETNRVMNLTAITEPRDVEIRHLLDCVAPCALPCLSGRVADIGTGGGLPGVVVAILRPDAQLTLIDATGKKLRFIEETCARLGIAVKTLHGRAEELARGPCRESFDCATARAVAALPVLLEYGLPLVRVGGHFVAMKGPEAAAEIDGAAAALRLLGGALSRQMDYALPGGLSRAALVFEKISQTAPKFPRNSGNIQKSPLK